MDQSNQQSQNQPPQPQTVDTPPIQTQPAQVVQQSEQVSQQTSSTPSLQKPTQKGFKNIFAGLLEKFNAAPKNIKLLIVVVILFVFSIILLLIAALVTGGGKGIKVESPAVTPAPTTGSPSLRPSPDA